jgi:RHS repeat-associated protein
MTQMKYSSKPAELKIVQERITSQIGRGNFSTLASPVTDTATANRKVRRADSLLLALNPAITDTTAQLSYLITLTNRQKDTCEAYWYHPDHLGSSSWITFSDGKAVEHLHYLPWGEDFVRQRSTDWHAMYTFSAKEKDAETGYSYFGARYYSSDLSIWLSVDPLADEFLSISPYNYCSDNPLKLKDPNGEGPIRALIGAAVGAAVNATCAVIEHKSGSEVFAAAVGGAVTGAVTAENPLARGLASAAGNYVEQRINVAFGNKDKVDYVEVGISGVIGGASSGMASKAKSAVTKPSQQVSAAKSTINAEVKAEMKQKGYVNGHSTKTQINRETEQRFQNYQKQVGFENEVKKKAVEAANAASDRESTNGLNSMR